MLQNMFGVSERYSLVIITGNWDEQKQNDDKYSDSVVLAYQCI